MSTEISLTAFNKAIPSAVTNEIPHLPTYDILNSQIRMNWSRQLVGKAITKYEQLTSEKYINGKQSENYRRRDLIVVDPENDQQLMISLEKPSFSIEGAFETEMDYLMHENARYLSKLYPDDLFSLVTLTEAERQSYFNEANHLIHSYFDTEQIETGDDIKNLYYRNRFLTGITKVKAETGIYKQEEDLLNLLNVNNFDAYSGYKIFIDSFGNSSISIDQKENLSLDDIYLYKYSFSTENSLKREIFFDFKGKILDNLSTFLENYSEEFKPQNAKNLLKSFGKIDSAAEFLEQVLNGENSINSFLEKGVDTGILNSTTSLDALIQNDVFGPMYFDAPEVANVSFVFGSKSKNVIVLNNESNEYDLDLLKEASGSYYIEKRPLNEMDEMRLLKMSSLKYNELADKVLGNVLISHFTSAMHTQEDFETALISVKNKSNQFVLKYSIRQLMDKDEAAEERKKIIALKAQVEKEIKEKEKTEDSWYGVENPFFIESSTEPDFTKWNDYLNDQNDNYLNVGAEDISDAWISAKLAYKAGKLRKTYKYLEDAMNFIDNDIYYEVICGFFDEKFLADYGEDDFVLRFDYSNFGEDYALSNISKCILDPMLLEKNIYKGNETTICKFQVLGFSEVMSFPSFFDPATFEEKVKNMGIIREGNSVTNYGWTYSNAFDHNGAKIAFGQTQTNLIEVEIEILENFKEFFKRNTGSEVLNKVSIDGTIRYYKNFFAIGETFSNEVVSDENIFQSLFEKTSLDFFQLQTYPCYFFSEDTVRLSGDVRRLVEEQGRVDCILRDNYGNFYACIAFKSWVENEYCYVKFLDVSYNLSLLENRKGYIIMDPKRISVGTEDETLKVKERRGFYDKQVLRNKENFVFKNTWNDLLKNHLNYVFDNTFSTDPTVLSKDSVIGQNTFIPDDLVELEYCTILNLEDNLEVKNLILALIEENKSLYLDSSLKVLQQVPLGLNNLVYNPNYNTLSMQMKDGIPATVTFFNKEDITPYEPLKNMIDFLDQEDDTILKIEDLEKIYSRRKIIWGNVVWDANNVNRSVKVLRTIWAGFFSNFEIYTSSDIIPSEGVLSSLPGDLKGNSTKILNYNYSYNEGHPDILWDLVIIPPKIEKTYLDVKGVDFFSHKISEGVQPDSEKPLPVFSKEAFGHYALLENVYEDEKGIHRKDWCFNINDIFIPMNRVGVSGNLEFHNMLTHFNYLLMADDFGEDANFTYLDYWKTNDVEIKYDKTEGSFFGLLTSSSVEGNYEKGQKYNFRLIYNQTHLNEMDFNSINIFKNYCNGDTAFEMVLEYFLYEEFLNVCKKNYKGFNEAKQSLEDYGDESVEALLKKWAALGKESPLYSIKLKDLLERACDVKNHFYIPTIGVVNSETGIISFYYYRFVKNGENNFSVFAGSFEEPFCAEILLNTLNPEFSSFNIKKSLKEIYCNILNKYQYLIPSKKFTSSFKGIDINLNELSKIDGAFYDNDEVIANAEEVSKYLTNMVEKKIEVKVSGETGVDLQGFKILIDNEPYKLFGAVKFFKEYHPSIVQMSTADPENENANILKCNFRFTNDLNLSDNGMLYLYDIKAPNRRSSYSSSREITLINRSFTIENLRVEDYSNDGTFVLKDDETSGSRIVEKIIENINPLYEDKTQKIASTKMKIGKMWPSPDENIGYKFFKRKFIFEGKIFANALTTVEKSDDSLELSFVDHIETGDLVELMLLDPPAVYRDSSGNAIISAEGKTLTGPFKKLYEENIVTNGNATNVALFGGAGVLILVEVNLSERKVSLDVNSSKDNEKGTFFVSKGEIFYRNDLKTIKFADVDSYIGKNVINGISKFTTESRDVTPKVNDTLYEYDEVEGIEAPNIPDDPTEGTTKSLMGWHKDEGWNEFDLTEDIVDSVNIPSGTIYLTEKEKLYFENEEGSHYLSQPAEAEIFDASGEFDQITINDDLVIRTLPIEECSLSQLKAWIIESLQEYFYSKSSIVNEDEEVVKDAYRIYPNQTTTEEIPSSSGGVKTITVSEFNIHRIPERSLALLLSGKTLEDIGEGYDWKITESTVKVPKFVWWDTPVYMGPDEKPKWTKSLVAEDVEDFTLANATLESLQNFARALSRYFNITRKQANISSWAKSSKNIVLWDQGSGAITVMDKVGNVLKRVASPYIGYTAENSYEEGTSNILPVKAYTVPNTFFMIRPSKELEVYEGGEQEAYGFFERDGELDLVKILKDGGINEDFLDSEELESFETDGEIYTFRRILESRKLYTEYLNYRKNADFMAMSVCTYATLKIKSSWMSFQNLSRLLKDSYKKTAAFETIGGLAELGGGPCELVKGIPYLTYEHWLKNSCACDYDTSSKTDVSAWGIGCDPLLSMSIYPETGIFTSLIKESSIAISDGTAKIYGKIEWPELNESKNTSLLYQMKMYYEKLYKDAGDEKDALITSMLEELREQLQRNYNAFMQGDYTSGIMPFVISVDLNTYAVGFAGFEEIDNKKEGEDVSIISMIANGDSFTAYSAKGRFDAGDESNTIFAPEYETAALNSNDVKLLDLIKQMNTATKTIDVSESGEISILLKGSLVDNPVMIQTRVLTVNDDTFEIEDDSLLLDEGDVTAIVLVSNKTKDNFQFGYGEITNFAQISPAYSMFEVKKPDAADFVSYANKYSYQDESTRKIPDVFDIYPAWEEIDESLRKYFYKVSGKKVEYLKNNTVQNGAYRNLLRISDPTNSEGFGGLIYKESIQSVAGNEIKLYEKISGVTGDDQMKNALTPIIVDDLEMRGMGYTSVINRYGPQRVPALIGNPYSALLTYAYKEAEIEINGNGSDYLEVDSENNTITLKTSPKTPLNKNSFFTGVKNSNGKIVSNLNILSLELKITNITNTLPKYEPITKYGVNLKNAEGDSIIASDSIEEVIIPINGYGQAMIGDYKTPRNCLFDDEIFYRQSNYTRNSKGTALKLKTIKEIEVNGETRTEIVDLGETLPALCFRSFKAADVKLDSELSTKDGIYLKPFFMDLSNYTVTPKNVCFEFSSLTPDMVPSDGTDLGMTAENQAYTYFKENLRFSCKVLYSVDELDEESTYISDFAKIGFYKNLEGEDIEVVDVKDLIKKLGYTRFYSESNSIPSSVRYLNDEGHFKFTASNFSRENSRRTADSEGKLLGVNVYSELSTNPSPNDYLPAPSYEGWIDRFSAFDNIFTDFSVNGDVVQSAIPDVESFLKISKAFIYLDYNTDNLFIKSSNPNYKTIIFFEDPSKFYGMINEIQNIEEVENEDGEIETRWKDKEKFKLRFNNLNLSISFDNSFLEYNFAYLKDKNGEVIAKIYFGNKIQKDSILIFSEMN